MTIGKLILGLALIPFAWFFLICWKVFGALGFDRPASKCWIIGLRITTRGSKLLGEPS
jgi:hypothetical protein